MPIEGNSFLPRILSVFYAVFDDSKGANIVYQVPEGSIATSPTHIARASGSPRLKSLPSEISRAVHRTNTSNHTDLSRVSVSSHNSRLADSRDLLPRNKRSLSIQHSLFKFADISRYVIPPTQLCGRLITCTTRQHRVIGFPVALYNEKRYDRNYFRYNVCLVFDRIADLSCYEPIVRKIGRVLTACEEESSFLSSPKTSHTIYAILEQLYEDLNSFSETSIPIDDFNSIELKIFPFYPNPPKVEDWQVPIALINLKKRIEDNWDLTMTKVCSFIDGINHVSRIAHLADCDLDLTRKAVQHLLYYQVIMMIDIFQFNNMYTLCRSVEWLANENHLKDECGPYVTKIDSEISEWPDLLHLYSRLKPGISVYEWMQEYDTYMHGIDPRRFVSFGVIKGFLRRVHRWPVLLPERQDIRKLNGHERDKDRRLSSPPINRRRGKSLNIMPSGIGSNSGSTTPTLVETPVNANGLSFRGNYGQSSSKSPETSTSRTSTNEGRFVLNPPRKASAVEKSIEALRRSSEGTVITGILSATSSPRIQRIAQSHQGPRPAALVTEGGLSRRHSVAQPPISSGSSSNGPLPLTALFQPSGGSSGTATEFGGETPTSGMSTPTRSKLSRSPSTQTAALPQSKAPDETKILLENLKVLLDGTHHTDELGTRFEIGWPKLETYLVTIGGGRGDGDFGRIEIIYR